MIACKLHFVIIDTAITIVILLFLSFCIIFLVCNWIKKDRALDCGSLVFVIADFLCFGFFSSPVLALFGFYHFKDL